VDVGDSVITGVKNCSVSDTTSINMPPKVIVGPSPADLKKGPLFWTLAGCPRSLIKVKLLQAR